MAIVSKTLLLDSIFVIPSVLVFWTLIFVICKNYMMAYVMWMDLLLCVAMLFTPHLVVLVPDILLCGYIIKAAWLNRSWLMPADSGCCDYSIWRTPWSLCKKSDTEGWMNWITGVGCLLSYQILCTVLGNKFPVPHSTSHVDIKLSSHGPYPSEATCGARWE